MRKLREDGDSVVVTLDKDELQAEGYVDDNGDLVEEDLYVRTVPRFHEGEYRIDVHLPDPPLDRADQDEEDGPKAIAD